MSHCPHCQSEQIKKNGLTKLGYQQYQCKVCKKHWSDNPRGKGRPSVNQKAMTDAERAKNYRLKRRLLGRSRFE
ncbi:MAG: InsA N-terminal domain [Cyanobacteriota bacterium]|jgi:transposase-like protein